MITKWNVLIIFSLKYKMHVKYMLEKLNDFQGPLNGAQDIL